jgi:hypothetical protein
VTGVDEIHRTVRFCNTCTLRHGCRVWQLSFSGHLASDPGPACLIGRAFGRVLHGRGRGLVGLPVAVRAGHSGSRDLLKFDALVVEAHDFDYFTELELVSSGEITNLGDENE